MKKTTLVALVLLSLLPAACAAKPVTGEVVQVAGGSYRNITAAELAAILDNKDFVLVNVHIPFEGDLPGTDLSIPYDQIEQNLSQLPADRNARIVLYCRSGRMSAIAAESLVRLGYTDIWDLEGGMLAWEAAGFPLKDE